VDREVAPVAKPPIGADLGEALDRLRALPAQVALDLEARVDVGAELRDLVVGQVLDLLVGIEAELLADLLRGRLTDPVDVGQADLEPLLIRKVDAGDTCHVAASPAFACDGGWCRSPSCGRAA
jgi:hypothetical protein